MNSVEGLSGVTKMNQTDAFGSEWADVKKHKTADTSVESFLDLLKSGEMKKQNDRMLACLAVYQPLTRRMAAEKTGMELNSAGRCINSLENAGKVKIAFTAKSPHTKKRVRFYALEDWEQRADEKGGSCNVN